MSEGEDAATQRLIKLLTRLLNSPIRPPGWTPSPAYRVWDSQDDYGARIVGEASWLTDRIVEWFKRQGWLASAWGEDVFVAPFVEVDPPDYCYHVTPTARLASILERGLLRGVDAGHTTTNRPDAAGRIHVSFVLDAAVAWTGPRLLGKHQPGQEWAIIQIDRSGIAGKVFRDPASQTGYILEAGMVAPGFLQVAQSGIASGTGEASEPT